jgi:hypothetical protein
MADSEFTKQVTAQARRVARAEFDLRRARKLVSDLEVKLAESKRQLRLLVQSTEPYTPPAAGSASAAQERIEGPQP